MGSGGLKFGGGSERGVEFGVWGSERRIQGSGFEDQGSGFGVQGSRIRVHYQC